MATDPNLRIERLLEQSRDLREQCQKTLAAGGELHRQTRRLLEESEDALARAEGLHKEILYPPPATWVPKTRRCSLKG